MDIFSHEKDIPIPRCDNGHSSSRIHDSPSLHTSNGPLPPPLSIVSTQDHQHQHNRIIPYISKKEVVVRYMECLKNHAATIGKNATDGCGEFMPSAEEGTLEALTCSVCGCHRNFHRREMEDCHHQHRFNGRKVVSHHKSIMTVAAEGHGLITRPPPPPHLMVMPLGAVLERDGMEGVVVRPTPHMLKKRFRTKFTAEQKEKMLDFAERVGWRMQKQEKGVVQQLCQEIGVERKALKVWMHNNKRSLGKKDTAV